PANPCRQAGAGRRSSLIHGTQSTSCTPWRGAGEALGGGRSGHVSSWAGAVGCASQCGVSGRCGVEWRAVVRSRVRARDSSYLPIHSDSLLCSRYTNGYIVVMNDSTPDTLREVADLRRQRDELDQQIAKLTPRAIEEGYEIGLRAEVIAVEIGISVSRVHQI